MVNPTGYTALDMIGFTDQGAYSSSDNYVKNDLVHYSGNIWRCLIDDTSGIAPVEGVNWTLFIGEPTNLVERIIAPVETDPATNAWAVGRQIIFNDNLYEVIAAISAGDALVAYEDDPTNANIKLADPVETQLLNEEAARAAADLALRNNLSNRNLLDNGWFTVNQRGASSYSDTTYRSEGKYTFDRWNLVTDVGGGSIAKSGNNIVFTKESGASYVILRQKLEDYSFLEDKTLTMSVLMSDGTVHKGTATFVNSSTNINFYSASDLTLRFNDGNFQFVCKVATISIKAIKLELGSISTLAMDTVPNYAEELLKCQRYFFRKTISSGVPIGFGFSVNSTQARLAFTTPTIMRSTPSISPSTNDGTGIGIVYNGNSLSSTAISIHGMLENIVDILVSVASGLPGDNYPISARSNSNMYIDFSSDL